MNKEDLLFVAMTRARNELCLVHQQRANWPTGSRVSVLFPFYVPPRDSDGGYDPNRQHPRMISAGTLLARLRDPIEGRFET